MFRFSVLRKSKFYHRTKSLESHVADRFTMYRSCFADIYKVNQHKDRHIVRVHFCLMYIDRVSHDVSNGLEFVCFFLFCLRRKERNKYNPFHSVIHCKICTLLTSLSQWHCLKNLKQIRRVHCIFY